MCGMCEGGWKEGSHRVQRDVLVCPAHRWVGRGGALRAGIPPWLRARTHTHVACYHRSGVGGARGEGPYGVGELICAHSSRVTAHAPLGYCRHCIEQGQGQMRQAGGHVSRCARVCRGCARAALDHAHTQSTLRACSKRARPCQRRSPSYHFALQEGGVGGSPQLTWIEVVSRALALILITTFGATVHSAAGICKVAWLEGPQPYVLHACTCCACMGGGGQGRVQRAE